MQCAGLELWCQSPKAPLRADLVMQSEAITRAFTERVLGHELGHAARDIQIVVRPDRMHQALSREQGAKETFGFFKPGKEKQIAISDRCWSVDRDRHRVTRDLPLDALPFIPYGIIAHELTHAYLDAERYPAAHAEIYPWAVYQLVIEELRAQETGKGLALRDGWPRQRRFAGAEAH